MPFIQIIEFRTDDIEKIRAIDDQWERDTEGKRTVRRAILTSDRNDPGRYVEIVCFDSYEAAMQNSNLPETQQAADQIAAIAQEVTFHDLDVIDDRLLC